MRQCALQAQILGPRMQGPVPPRSQSLAAPPSAGLRQPLTHARRQAVVVAVGFFGRGDSNASRSSTQDTLVSDGAIRSLSPEARRIFREAQDNIIELNKSRLRALDELKVARQKIAELEDKLETAVAEAGQATAQLQQLGPGGTEAAAEAVAAAISGVTYKSAQQQQPPAASTPPPTGDTITIVYETGWGAAYLHHNVDGQGWSSTPGTQMQNGNQQFPDKKVIMVPGRRMEFVINNGGSDWDKPNPYSASSGNYVVTEPGTYRVKNGKLTRLA